MDDNSQAFVLGALSIAVIGIGAVTARMTSRGASSFAQLFGSVTAQNVNNNTFMEAIGRQGMALADVEERLARIEKISGTKGPLDAAGKDD